MLLAKRVNAGSKIPNATLIFPFCPPFLSVAPTKMPFFNYLDEKWVYLFFNDWEQ